MTLNRESVENSIFLEPCQASDFYDRFGGSVDHSASGPEIQCLYCPWEGPVVEEIQIANPVKRGYALRLSRPLPRHPEDEEVVVLLNALHGGQDQGMFRLILQCGLRVEEVENLTLGAIDQKRRKIFVENGKGAKDRVVYITDHAWEGLREP